MREKNIATWTALALALGADFSLPRQSSRRRDARSADDVAERIAAAEAKRARRAKRDAQQPSEREG